MPINARPEYIEAEKKYLSAESLEEKLDFLKEMIRTAPKHKGSENLLKELRLRYKKLRERFEKQRKKRKGKPGIKKAEMQIAIIGMTNTGKSSLLSALTNATPKISPYPFTTKSPIIGTMQYEDIQMQIIEIPAFESEYYNKGIANTADLLIILITQLEHLSKIEANLQNAVGKKIIVFNQMEKINEGKPTEKLRKNKFKFLTISTKTKEGIEDLQKEIWRNLQKIRIYTLDSAKNKIGKPLVLDSGATVRDAAEKIFHGFSHQISETEITGPSAKFPNQKVSLNHQLKDKDIIKFRIK